MKKTLKNRNIAASILILSLLLLFFAGCTLPLQFSGNGQPSISIISPLDGAELASGTPINIVSSINDPAGVYSFILMENSLEVRTDHLLDNFYSGNFYQPWPAQGRGEYTLQVKMISTSGDTYLSQQITVYLGDHGITPTFTPTQPSITPTIPTFTITPTLASATPEEVTATGTTLLNCRSGPGYGYEPLDGLAQGQAGIVLATNPETTWVQMTGPNDRFIKCWVPVEYLTIAGRLETLPILQIQPITETPTFTPGVIAPQKDTKTPTPTLTPEPGGTTP